MSVLKLGLLLVSFLLLLSKPVCASSVKDLYEQAVEAYNQQDFDRSIKLYQEITKLAPHFAAAYIGIGLSLKSQGADTDEVLYYYKLATEVDPTSAAAFEQLGRLYYALNNFDKAEPNFLKEKTIFQTN